MLQVNFIMNGIIHKISVLLKITRSSKCFLRSITDFHFLKKIIIFLRHITMECSSPEEDKNIEKT